MRVVKSKSKKKSDVLLKDKKEKKEKAIPYHRQPADMTLDEWQAALRKQFAAVQDFKVENIGEHQVFSDFIVYNPLSDKSYKVAIRSDKPGLNFCSCPDFKINLLGTCKHVEFLLNRINSEPKTKTLLLQGNEQSYSSISLKYGEQRKVYLRIGTDNHEQINKIAKKYFDKNNYLRKTAFNKFEKFLEEVQSLDSEFRSYPDAVEYILNIRNVNNRRKLLDNKYAEGINSPELEKLLNAKLYTYQKEGILYAARAGRCLIADDMGLGKTIQAMATTEIFARDFNAQSALIICPTSLKYQWKSEIEKFTGRSALVIEGNIFKRIEQYKSDEFYKITSYNSIRNDIRHINNSAPDVVILDEAQRIKNWKTKTAQSVKTIESEFALVLTGTPLENRIDELHSLVQFVDPFKLGPMFRFLNKHQLADDNGKIIGYQGLHEISKTLESIVIRRKKSDVLLQLPERMDNNYFVDATPQQIDAHADFEYYVALLVNKWRRQGFLSEPERKKLLINLSCMRMVCDSTYLLDQKTRHDTKIDELVTVLEDIFESTDDKVVIFSQWERMTRLVAQELERMDVKYEYLHGGIPSIKRKDLISNFTNDPKSKVFLSTDAGGVGLNLQAANVVINLDIPWNPAVLEQRIARVYRLGQGKHVSVINFVTKDSIEHRILGLLNYKQSVFDGVFDKGEDQVVMDNDKFKKIMNLVENLSEPEMKMSPPSTDEATSQDAYGESADTEKIESEISTSPEESIERKEEIQTSEGSESEEIQPQAEPQQNIQDLFVTGIDFLQKLSNTFSDKNSTRSLVNSLIQKDEKTGNMSLNIPIKDEKVVEKAVNMLESLLGLFKQK